MQIRAPPNASSPLYLTSSYRFHSFACSLLPHLNMNEECKLWTVDFMRMFSIEKVIHEGEQGGQFDLILMRTVMFFCHDIGIWNFLYHYYKLISYTHLEYLMTYSR